MAEALDAIDLVRDGASYRLAERFGLAATTVPRRVLKVAVLFVVTWVPLLLLSLSAGHAVGTEVQVPFAADPRCTPGSSSCFRFWNWPRSSSVSA